MVFVLTLEGAGNRVSCPYCGHTLADSMSGDEYQTAASLPCSSGDSSQTLAPPTMAKIPGSDDYATAAGVPPAEPMFVPAEDNCPISVSRFQVRKKLGAGAFGIVYRAYDPQLDRDVALKVAKPQALLTNESVRGFLREARAAANLCHPHIVPVFDSGMDGDQCFIASAFIPGRTLAHAVAAARDKPLDVRRMAHVVRQLAEALAYAHKMGVVHRDVKPANVLLDEQGEPMLADFGLARREDGQALVSQDAAQIVGTPAFMAPEQAEGKALAASDQYSLGVVMYELLTGRLPFDGGIIEQIDQHRTKDPAPLRTVNPALPRDLETICLKSLEKDPARRYANCQALADDVRRWLEGEPIQARTVRWPERAIKWARKRPAVTALLAVTVVTTHTMLIGGWIAYGRAIRDKHDLERAQADVTRVTAERHRADIEALVRLNVINGTHHLNEGDLYGSLIWFTRALKLDDDTSSESRRAHHVRIATVLRECPRLAQFWRHQNRVTDVKVSPDGRWVVTSSNDNTARVWSIDTGMLRYPALKHEHHVTRVSWSPDGLRIVTASADKTAKVWDAFTGQELLTLRGHSQPLRDVDFSPDSRKVVTASDDHTARVWDVVSGRELHVLGGHAKAVVRASFRWDGKRILTASADHTVRIWDTKTGEGFLTLKGHADALTDACFSHDGRLVVTASKDETARIWNARTGELRTDEPLHHNGWVHHVVFSPDDSQVATASADLTARVWNVATGRMHVPALRHNSSVDCVIFSPDGSELVTASDDNTARIWDDATGRPLSPPLTHNSTVSRVCFSPDGSRIVTAAEDATARLYERKLARPPLKHQGSVNHVTFSPDGRSVATASSDNMARVWDARSSKLLVMLDGHRQAVIQAHFDSTGRRIVTASIDRTAKIWDAATGKLLVTLEGHKGPVNTARFSPDGSQVVTSSDDGTARIWNVSQGVAVYELIGSAGLQAEHIHDAVFSPDGDRVATASSNRTAQIWNAATGQPTGKSMHHEYRIIRVAFSPDGRQLVTASHDRTARLWDAFTGESQRMLQHAGVVRDAEFSPSGSWVVTGSDDNTARVWSTTTGQAVLPPLRHNGGVTRARFSHDENRVVTTSYDNTARVWDTRTGLPLTPALTHGDWGQITGAAFSPSGDLVVTASEDGTAQVWDLGSENLPTEDLDQLAELLGGSRVSADGASLVPLTAEVLEAHWLKLRKRHIFHSLIQKKTSESHPGTEP
jgi:WD40 repeat protein